MLLKAPTDDPAVQAAYRSCEAVTREQAANFYYGIRLLPAPKRRAMSAVYAFARRIDDIGDGQEPDDVKLAALAAARDALKHGAREPMYVALADAQRRFALPRDALTDLITGVESDVHGERYETFDELVVYCRRVAGTIGRLCVAIFGATDAVAAEALADDLGVAMQLTNILRDVREDLDNGRVYLPAQELRRFGCEDLAGAGPAEFSALVAFEAARARDWFDRGLQLRELIDARSRACVSAMTGIYRELLERIEREPTTVMQRRMSLTPLEKTWVAVRSLAGMQP